MVYFPYKRVFGLIGAPRSGKNVVANYLQESRNFVSFAFADKIKDEYGISKEYFELAKSTGEIDALRKELWEFSAHKKAKDPEYFIKLVMDEVRKTGSSVVITDIRTTDEFNAIFTYLEPETITRAYLLEKNYYNSYENGFLLDSKISKEFIEEQVYKDKVKIIKNLNMGIYRFYKKLDSIFFEEDVMDLGPCMNSDNYKNDYNKWRYELLTYISQFNITER